ncbi:Hypothetical predicted protein [Mytilus galloprovincialis]|uniref:WSC domain-containing protein n=1 Tax=Mytilus galloprovincialis TaxID=29158 RepID=A0A8B6GVE4_MYTGA|nr:Hypothetical predicted protein [Mytilus galloprovincialis]
MGDFSEDELYTDAGCYENKKKGPSRKRLLSDGPHSRNPMSAKICYEICTSRAIRDRFNYFGTQNTNQCFCGEVAKIMSDDNQSLKRLMSKCNDNCLGSVDEKCGSKHNALLYKRKGNETTTTKDDPTSQAKKVSLAGIGIGVACLILVAICCVIIWRRRLLRKKIRKRSNTYRNAEDMSVTSNQNEQRQENPFSYTELIVYNHNHAYDELQMETNDTINGKTEVLDNSEGARVFNDNYTVLVVPEDQNSSLVSNTAGFIESISETNPTIGAYAILDPKETGFDRTKQEQELKADSYAVLDPAETGFDRTKDRDDVLIQSVRLENSNKALRDHAIKNKEIRDEMKNQNEDTHSINMTSTIESIENNADTKVSKKTNIGIGAYAILDPDATGFDRTKPEPKVYDDSYTVLDPAETGFDRMKDSDDMPSQSENSVKDIYGDAIQNKATNDEVNHSLNKDGQYDLLNQVYRPQDDNEHTYSHSVDAVYDTTNQNRTPRTEDSSHAYDHL